LYAWRIRRAGRVSVSALIPPLSHSSGSAICTLSATMLNSIAGELMQGNPAQTKSRPEN
jgi:hypothetical protein